MSSKNKDLEKVKSNEIIEKVSSDNKDSRRSLLKKLAVGGIAGAAMPTKWSKPVIDSVVLPAHAETSNAPVQGGGGGTSSPPGPSPDGSIGEDILDFFTTPAHAGGTVRDFCVEIVVDPPSGDDMKVVCKKVCFNTCFRDDMKFYDQTVTNVTLSGGGGNWTGEIPTVNSGTKTLTLSSLDISANILCTAKLEDAEGDIVNGGTCNCPCSPST